MLLAGDFELHRLGAGSDQEFSSLKNPASYRDRPFIDEIGVTVESIDLFFVQRALPLARHGIGEMTLLRHQFAPVDRCMPCGYSACLHALDVVENLRSADQYFLRIASPQRTCAAKRTLIDHCNTATGRSTNGSRPHGGHSRSDDDDIVRGGGHGSIHSSHRPN